MSIVDQQNTFIDEGSRFGFPQQPSDRYTHVAPDADRAKQTLCSFQKAGV